MILCDLWPSALYFDAKFDRKRPKMARKIGFLCTLPQNTLPQQNQNNNGFYYDFFMAVAIFLTLCLAVAAIDTVYGCGCLTLWHCGYCGCY
jgi:hypothetical protein